MENKQINPIIFGATGLAGSGVFYECLKHPDVGSILVISRRSTEIKHEKLT